MKLAKTITERWKMIEAAINSGLSNARVEEMNIRLITGRGVGCHSREAVIALAVLSLGGLGPPRPGPPRTRRILTAERRIHPRHER